MITPGQRQGLALARGFIVFAMPAVHSVMLYSAETVKQGWLGKLLAFIAEGPGAQLFMFLMGVFIVLGRPKTLRQILARSLMIGLLGYLLNLLRLVLPYYLNLLPTDYISCLTVAQGGPVGWQLFRVGDILQFASLAYFFCALLFKYCSNLIVIIGITIMLWWLSPYTWKLNGLSHTIFLDLLTGTPPGVFFPLFPWIFYPMLGLVGGSLFRTVNPRSLLAGMFIMGCVLMAAGKLLVITEPLEWYKVFYRQGRGGVLYHAGVSLLWLSFFISIAHKNSAFSFFRFLAFLSRHITMVYVIQWIIIMWMFGLFGYNQLNLPGSILALIVTSSLSFGLAGIITRKTNLKKRL